MDSLFQGLKGVSVYLDNILVTGHTQEEHLENLERVLAKLDEVGLKLNKAKCKFMMPRVEYLGYVIDRDGLHPTSAKVQAMYWTGFGTVTGLAQFEMGFAAGPPVLVGGVHLGPLGNVRVLGCILGRQLATFTIVQLTAALRTTCKG